MGGAINLLPPYAFVASTETALPVRFARKHEERLLQHENVEAFQVLDNSELPRKLQRTKPPIWYHEHYTQNTSIAVSVV
jgi:hypothetical protein